MAAKNPFSNRAGLVAGVLLLVTTIAVVAFVNTILSQATSDLLRRHATDISRSWSDYFNSRIPDIETAYATRNVTDEQLAIIRDTELYGSVFRFKMFAPDGTLFFVSDEGRFSAENDEPDTEPLEVMRTGANLISLEDGRDNPNRPDSYAEAYVPALDRNGKLIGAMEIYTDVTPMETILTASFQKLRVILPLLAALIYLLPSVGVVVVTHQKKKNAARLADARIDPLTGALNRRALTEEASRLFETADTDLGATGILFLDADNFKTVNDTLGHASGDAYLKILVERVWSVTRPTDIVGRLGGDEFVIVMPGIERSLLRDRAAQICRISRDPMDLAGNAFHGSVSVGAALSAGIGDDFEALLERADKALYAAKRHGRGCAVVDDGTGQTEGELISPFAA